MVSTVVLAVLEWRNCYLCVRERLRQCLIWKSIQSELQTNVVNQYMDEVFQAFYGKRVAEKKGRRMVSLYNVVLI